MLMDFFILKSSNQILRIHCFNNYKGQQCQDLEISYLIECKIEPEKRNKPNSLRIDEKSIRNIICKKEPIKPRLIFYEFSSIYRKALHLFLESIAF